MSKNNLHKFFITAYRSTSFLALSSILSIAVGYLLLLIFFTLNSSWSAPLVLSPAQERVLSFQPQIATLEATLNKQKIELVTAKATVNTLGVQVSQMDHLLTRIDGAMSTESASLNATGKAIDRLLADKKVDIKQTDSSIRDAQTLLKQVDSELAAKLITSDQAASRRIALQSALNAATDAKSQALQLAEQSRQLQAGAHTLNGGATSIAAITAVKQAVDLRALQAQAQIQLVTATATSEALVLSIAENERVIAVAKTSPYYRALRESVPVAFVPYENLGHVKAGLPVYDCYLKVIACRKVGEVTKVYDAEEYARHPLFKTDMKGRLAEIKYTNIDSAQSQVVFIGGKPLFL